MNKTLIFLILATSILVLSAIVICISPIINNIEVILPSHHWKPGDWKNLNCQFFEDKIKAENIELDELQKYKKYKNLCKRQKAMYGLENSAFIINIILAFVCADLMLLHYLNIGKTFEKKTGLIGLISGIIGFILTLFYVCYSGYIFNNDIAYGSFDFSNVPTFINPQIPKLFPNGAKEKKDGTGQYITVSQENGENSNFVLYKDLGKKQYNYNNKYYQTYNNNNLAPPLKACKYVDKNDIIQNSIDCEYLYYNPNINVINKYIHDRWLTALILAVFIVICNAALSIFGFLLFKSSAEEAPLSEQTPIIYKK